MKPPLIGLTGHIGAGKDTVAGILVRDYGYVRIGFADTLKHMALAVNPIIFAAFGKDPEYVRLRDMVEHTGWEEAKKHPEVRRFLQVLGTEGVRDHLGQDAWVRALEYKVEVSAHPVVVNDVRFPNEAEWIREYGGLLWRVDRPGRRHNNHVSESMLDELFVDYVIDNSGPIAELTAQVSVVLREVT